ncbi:venom serine protease Bi-VSP-like [Sergentomyia squamirostris]
MRCLVGIILVLFWSRGNWMFFGKICEKLMLLNLCWRQYTSTTRITLFPTLPPTLPTFPTLPPTLTFVPTVPTFPPPILTPVPPITMTFFPPLTTLPPITISPLPPITIPPVIPPAPPLTTTDQPRITLTPVPPDLTLTPVPPGLTTLPPPPPPIITPTMPPILTPFPPVLTPTPPVLTPAPPTICDAVAPTCPPSIAPGQPAILANGCPCIDPRTAVLNMIVDAIRRGDLRLRLNCYTPNLIPGNCVTFQSCGILLELLQQYYQTSDIRLANYIQRSFCGQDAYSLYACCPLAGPSSNSLVFYDPSDTLSMQQGLSKSNSGNAYQCGVFNATFTKVVGGENAPIGAWPWIALLGYRSSSQEVSFVCSGSLITRRHVLTAAHCIKDTLSFVRLGEYDLSTNTDGIVQDIMIDRKIVHEGFQSKSILNDIALLILSQAATVNERVSPVCLPTDPNIRQKDLTYYQPFVVGWGATSYRGPAANILQQAQVPVLPLSDCETNYKSNFPSLVFDEKIMCAGWPNGGRDSCTGDSGGGLYLPQLSADKTFYFYNIIGIVSYGYECALPGFPGVYTRITTFLPWILNNLDD